MAKPVPCTCKDRKAWHLDQVERVGMSGKLYGWVSCRQCNGYWRTPAEYIRSLSGSEKYQKEFRSYDLARIENLEIRKKILDERTSEIAKEKCQIEAQIAKLKERWS